MADVRVGCRNCGKKVLMDVMKHDPDNRKSLICPECYNFKIRKRNMNSRARKVLLGMKEEKKQDSYADFECSSCGYQFRRKMFSQGANVCPYCGKKTAVQKQKASYDWTKELC